MRVNSIVKKDLKVSARSMRLCWGLFAYEAMLTMVFILVMQMMQMDRYYAYDDTNIYSYLVYLFPVIGVLQLGIIALITPIITASSISGEKERQTFDIMLTTCMSPFSIVLGKVISAVLQILFYVVASLPIMALSFVFGGLSWMTLLHYFFLVVLFAFFSGSIGVFSSSVCRKSITAIILSFVFYTIIYGTTFIPFIVRLIMGFDDGGECLLWLFFNPGVLIEEFFMKTMAEISLFSGNTLSKDDIGGITYFIIDNNLWSIISGCVMILMTLGFILLAAWKVNPMHAISRKKRAKKV